MGKILLYYKYVFIEYPKRVLKWQQQICSDLNLKGRIFIGHEGINGTVGGTAEDIERYKITMSKNPLFADIDFKESEGDASYFPKMEIKVKKEVVHLGIDPEKLTVNDTGEHLSPDQVHALLTEKPDDLVILDARNNYEWRIGKFKDAITPDIENFRDLPQFIDQNIDQFKDKQVLMYCTGGIRCERATAYLNTKNVAKKVFQIDGGIVRYCEKYPEGFFRGKNYVFDRRVAVTINDDILSNCDLCNTACNEYTNCINAECNEHYIACTSCVERYNNCCSSVCHELVINGKVKKRTPFQKAQEANACSINRK
jgi:predicted sulfurtransferase